MYQYQHYGICGINKDKIGKYKTNKYKIVNYEKSKYEIGKHGHLAIFRRVISIIM